MQSRDAIVGMPQPRCGQGAGAVLARRHGGQILVRATVVGMPH